MLEDRLTGRSFSRSRSLSLSLSLSSSLLDLKLAANSASFDVGLYNFDLPDSGLPEKK